MLCVQTLLRGSFEMRRPEAEERAARVSSIVRASHDAPMLDTPEGARPGLGS